MKCLAQRDRQLLEQRVDDAEAWHNLGRRGVAAVELADRAFDAPRHLARVRDVIDDERVIECRFGDVKRRFLEDRRVQRTPADILAVRDELVLGPQRAAVCFDGSKERVGGSHVLLPSSWGPFLMAPLRVAESTLPRD